MKVSLILTCAGKGERAKQQKNKLLVKTNGITLFEKTLSAFIKSNLINEYIVTSSAEDMEEIKKLAVNCTVVLGGETRTASVKNALNYVSGDIVLIHDGARPYVKTETIKNCLDGAIQHGSGIACTPCRDTVIKDDGEYIGKNGLFLVQTPQAFDTKQIKRAYSLAKDQSFNDDGEVYQKYIGKINLVNGSYENIKITYPEDFESLKSKDKLKFGVGFDCHRLTENRKLILGGVTIPHDKGLLGHSDADVLTHAVMDAILSSLSLRDIGYHFPDKDPKYKGISSMQLLQHVLSLIKDKGYTVDSVTAVIMAEKPKLLNYIPAIAQNLATALNISIENVGLTATTMEGLGFVGREEGICVHANAITKPIE